jgi:predicted HNH restriction endonuclease
MLRAAKLLGHETVCSACGTDYGKRAGGLGVHALDVHHLEPLGTRGAGITGLDELAVVCASCHRMLHGDGDSLMLTPEELGGRLRPPGRWWRRDP